MQMPVLKRHKTIPFSSGSAMINFRSQFFLIGDDAPDVLCLDADWKEIKRIKLLDYSAVRIPKPIKPDLESALVWNDKLYLLGSGSKLPQRSFIFVIDSENDVVQPVNNEANYEQLNSDNRIDELNIEGAVLLADSLFLFNRGNILLPNTLIQTQAEFLNASKDVSFDIKPIIMPEELKGYGISDAYYVSDDDVLILCASQENTTNAYDDGEVSGSILAVVHHAKTKLNAPEFVIETYINLNEVDESFNQQKIEAVCLYQKTESHYDLFLAADNDDGLTQLFEIQIERNG